MATLDFPLRLSRLRTQHDIHEDADSIPGLSGLRVWRCHKLNVRCTYGQDLVLPWLWCRPIAAPLIWPLAWELPYAAGAAVKKKKNGKTNLNAHYRAKHSSC